MASRSLNKVMIIGNLGSDPEVRMTPSGVQVATLSIATSRSWKDQSGESREKTEWHRVILWRGLADVAQRYLKKGNSVYIEGRLETRSWDDNSGQKRYTTEVIGDQMIMLGSASAGGSAESSAGYSSTRETATTPHGSQNLPNDPNPPLADGEDDLPF
jgi:single-strand DNA-binding protein